MEFEFVDTMKEYIIVHKNDCVCIFPNCIVREFTVGDAKYSIIHTENEEYRYAIETKGTVNIGDIEYKKSEGVSFIPSNENIDEKGDRWRMVLETQPLITEIIVGIIVDRCTAVNSSFVKCFNVYSCPSTLTTVQIIPFSSGGNLSSYLDNINLSYDFLFDIVYRLFSSLTEPKRLSQLLHNNCTSSNVFIDTNPFRMRIGNFSESSIQYRNLRIVPSGNYTKVFTSYDLERSIVPMRMERSEVIHNHMGFYLTYDYYTLLLSILFNPNVLQFIVNTSDDNLHSSRFGRLMDTLFDSLSKDIVMNELKRKRDSLNNSSIPENIRLKREYQSIEHIHSFLAKKNIRLVLDLEEIMNKIEGIIEYSDTIIDHVSSS